ncbi:MAG: hypothetical protein IID08_05245 [Candidatus Hydrogenedentes bacterium]|nr:hypothetical protein [Candidatus Hydrogenedentota bacterium]
MKAEMTEKRKAAWVFGIGAILTLALLVINPSSGYWGGFPVYLYFLYPYGEVLFYAEVYFYLTAFVYLIFWAQRFKRHYLIQASIVVLFLLLDMWGWDHAQFDIPLWFLVGGSNESAP